ncbi:hypothetical protein [Streptosporangium sp. KLBMP 9127]|nr:hypothetical protein [Streptosporangium sp. KLBMP 9127]
MVTSDGPIGVRGEGWDRNGTATRFGPRLIRGHPVLSDAIRCHPEISGAIRYRPALPYGNAATIPDEAGCAISPGLPNYR